MPLLGSVKVFVGDAVWIFDGRLFQSALALHGRGGQMELAALNGPRAGIRLVFEDKGPGIPNIDLALRDGFTTGSGLGLGLGGAKRLVNEFEVKSQVGEGTRVTVTRWK